MIEASNKSFSAHGFLFSVSDDPFQEGGGEDLIWRQLFGSPK